MHVEASLGGFAETLDCVLDGTTSATCTASQSNANDFISTMTDFTGSIPRISTVITSTLGGTMVEFVPVTITASAVKEGATPAAGNAKSTAATKTGALSTKATEASTSASRGNPASASGTTGAAPINVASAFGGGLMALAVGIVAAIL